MIGRKSLMSLGLIGLVFPSVLFAQPAAKEPAARNDRHALLVGVSFYENLPKEKHLAGPANDVVLMRKLLVEKLRFGNDRIVTLSEDEGKSRGKDAYPTKANIAREFKRLALIAKPGDQVVIHLGGHGSQQPEDKNSTDPEPDGLDEIFLPRDVGAWDGKNGTVVNAIIDDEISAWLKAIRDQKASVWITFDSCHSGTMIRGGDDSEKARDVDPEKVLGIPKTAIKEATALAAKRNETNPERSRGGNDVPPPFKVAKEGGIVAIYACQPNEVTYERELPAQSKDAKVYGLLTYSLCRILTEATEKSSKPLTYSELARRIHGQYQEWGRMSPTPLIEGVDRDRQVLGDEVWPGRSSIVLTEEEDGYAINAGALHGVTAGSVLAVKPPAGKGDMLLGHVRIKELSAYRSAVEPCAHEKTPVAKTLPAGGVCEVVFVDVGDQQLRVAVDPLDTSDKAIPEARLAELKKIVKTLAKQPLIVPVEQTKGADWLVRMHKENVVLIPGSGWAVSRAPQGEPCFGPAAIDANLGDWLQGGLSKIARAESLKRMAAGGDLSGQGKAVRLDLKISRKKNALDKVGLEPTEWPAPELPSFDKDRYVVKFTNNGRSPVDVTALYIDSGFGISCFYPRDGDLNRLRAGDSDSFSIHINGKTTGMEHLVFIAVKATGQPVDFAQLRQASLERATFGTRGAGLIQSLDTPLGRMLKRGMYGEGGTRAASTEELDDYAMSIISFNVRGNVRPAPQPK